VWISKWYITTVLLEHSVMSLPWTNIVAVRIYWNTDLFLPIVLLNYGTFQLCSCCHLFLHKPWWFVAFKWHPKFCVYQYLTMVAESCYILSTFLSYCCLWSYTCHDDLSSNRHRQHCMRSHGFGSTGGVRRDPTSLFMPPHPSGPVYLVMLCQPILI
jgi:hypothetical protein